MSDRIIYVLCYDDITEQKAHAEFDKFPWARVYRIPEISQNHLFEGVMYQTELMKVYDEWKDKKYVGTVGYNMFDRIKTSLVIVGVNIEDYINYIIGRIETPDDVDFVGFITIIRDMWDHPPYCKQIMRDLVFKNAKILNKKYYVWDKIDNGKPAYYSNYWMASPNTMLKYIHYFNTRWLPALESHNLIWTNAFYNGNLSREKLLKLSNGRCDYYPLHTFINERLPNIYFRILNVKEKP
jgi:hypothetical protein